MPLVVWLAVRLLAPKMMRAVFSQEGAQTAARLIVSGAAWKERLQSSEESDEELSVALSDAVGYPSSVATFSGEFELRRVQMIWTANDQAVGQDDVRVATLDLVKLAAGVPTSNWLAGDFTTVQTALNAFWTSLKAQYPPNVSASRIKIYKLGPNISPPQVPVYDAAWTGAGTNAITNMLPPQVALSVTEKAGSKLHWGRFYLPAPAAGTNQINPFGRPPSAFLGLVADYVDTLYETLRTNNLPVVVYRQPLPERKKKNGTTLPARNASAWTVDDIQIDDVYDVIRRRRWKVPTLRVQRQIG